MAPSRDSHPASLPTLGRMAAQRLELTLAMTSNPRSDPVLRGAFQPDGVAFRTTVSSAPDIFWRQLHAQEFDASEMSMSSLLIVLAQGNKDWIGLPIFTQRHFFQTWAWVRADAGIDKPQDLKGKRDGVPEYQQTAALWTRGILEHDFGVAPSDMDWYMERSADRSHGAATGFRPPEGVRFQYISADKSIGDMMLNGELDATLLYIGRQTLVDRSTVDFENNPKVRRLFPDVTAEGQRYFKETGIFPINHGMVLRRELYERHPWLALNIFNAFRLAREQVAGELRRRAETHAELGMLSPEAARALRDDPYPYGVKSNRQTLDTLAAYSHEQGLTPRQLALEEVFTPSTLDL
jgi:4,5-dihydroxyphthalate decarboxylase